MDAREQDPEARRPEFLLLLPPAPSPLSRSALEAAFGDTIAEVLKEVAAHAGILEIALACSHLLRHRSTPRAVLYGDTQTLLASVYRLICVTAARDNLDIETQSGVDVRIMLVAYSPDADRLEPNGATVFPYGPIVDISTLAQCGRPWQFAFGVESEAGEAMVGAFVAAKGSSSHIARVQNGPSPDVAVEENARPLLSVSPPRTEAQNQALYHNVAVGGTFDHLHVGHKLLLTMTVFAADPPRNEDGAGVEQDRSYSATVGITGDQLLVNKKYASVLESWSDRCAAVNDFLNTLLNFAPPDSMATVHRTHRNEPVPNGRGVDTWWPNSFVVRCTEIQDPFGPTITEKDISALVISAETRSGGKAVNDKRKAQGWHELEVLEVDVLDAESEGLEGGEGTVKEGFDSKISSTAIREKLARQTAVL